MIRLVYHRKNRILEPHDHGFLKGSVQLLGYQVGGSVLMKANEIADLDLLDRPFREGGPLPPA